MNAIQSEIDRSQLTLAAENLRKAAQMATKPEVIASLIQSAKAREIARDNRTQFDSMLEALDYGEWAVTTMVANGYKIS